MPLDFKALLDPAMLEWVHSVCPSAARRRNYDLLLSREQGDDRELGPLIGVRSAPPVVLCAQIQRSGGTLIGRLFDHHPQCLVNPGELYLDPASDETWPRTPPGDLDPLRAFASLFAARAHHFGRYLQDGYSHYSGAARGDQRLPVLFSARLQFEAYAALIEQNGARSARDIYDAYLASVFAGWVDHQRRYGPKSYFVSHVKRLNWMSEAEPFFRDYPDGRIVSILREPRSWLASAQRHWPARYSEFPASLAQWRENLANTVAIKERWPDRVSIVSFEELVTDTEAVMKRLSGALGLDYDAVLTRSTFNGIEIESNSSFAPTQGMDRSTVERRPEGLSASEEAALDAAVDEMPARPLFT